MPVAATVPVLTDGVVTLRAHTAGDLDGLVELATDPETVRWTRIPTPYGRSDAEDWALRVAPAGWRDGTAARWAVQVPDLTGAPRFAGNVDVVLDDPPFVGFGLAPWARGQGVARRAVRLATQWGLGSAGLPVVHWWARAGNLASWRVAHACGFAFDGTRRLAMAQRGALHDGWYASLAPGEGDTPRTTWWPVPVLAGRRVRLRAHTDADLPRIAAACSDARSRHWLSGIPHPYTVDDARRYVVGCRLDESLGRRVTWAVADPADDRLLGNISAFRLHGAANPGGAELGFWSHPDARGRGVIGEALDLVVAHAFAPRADGGLGRHRLQIGAAWSNTASRHVAERAGFTLLGRHHQDGLVGTGDAQVLDDGAWYELLATDRTGAPR